VARHRRPWLRFLTLLLLAACSARVSADGTSAPVSLVSVPVEASPVVDGESIRVELDLDEPVAEWMPVVFLSYGQSVEELGASDCYHCERVYPKTFAIDEDGSLWIADNAKGRIVHYDARGRYVRHARFRGAEGVRDLEMLGADVVTVFDNGTLVRFDTQGHVVERGIARHRNQDLYLFDLLERDGRLFAYSFGTDAGRGIRGAAEIVDIDGGSLRPVPGIPVTWSSSVWVDLLGHGRERWYRLLVTGANGSALLRRFEFVSLKAGGHGVLLVDVELEGVVPGRVIVSVNPLTAPWYDPVSAGKWLVTVGPHGNVQGTARIAPRDPPPQVLVVGADDRVYRMQYRTDGILIERR
jgi:hypothetical protein